MVIGGRQRDTITGYEIRRGRPIPKMRSEPKMKCQKTWESERETFRVTFTSWH